MPTFDDHMNARALPRLLAQFGEPAIYRPLGGLPRKVTVIVDRNPPDMLDLTRSGHDVPVVAPRLVIVASGDPADATYGGITADEIDSGGDLLEVPLRDGGAAEPLPITRVPNASPGGTTFHVL